MAAMQRTVFVFDLDGTLVDSVYQHVLAWQEALEAGGIELSVWRIHRRIGMSGGLFVGALLRETGQPVDADLVARLQQLHAQAYRRRATSSASTGWPVSRSSAPTNRPPLMPMRRWMRHTDRSIPQSSSASCQARTCW
jgi:phosphoglycolate phosphatase-like HAD superfamily hydrolase